MEKAEKEGLPKETGKPKLLADDESLPEKLPMIHFISDVSSGTYIRSLISDIGRAIESSAYMVELIRTKQSEWELGKNVFKFEDFEKDERIWGPVLKKVFEKGGAEIQDLDKEFEEMAKTVESLFTKETKESTSETIPQKDLLMKLKNKNNQSQCVKNKKPKQLIRQRKKERISPKKFHNFPYRFVYLCT